MGYGLKSGARYVRLINDYGVYINHARIDTPMRDIVAPMGAPLPPFIFKSSRDRDGEARALNVGNLMRSLVKSQSSGQS